MRRSMECNVMTASMALARSVLMLPMTRQTTMSNRVTERSSTSTGATQRDLAKK